MRVAERYFLVEEWTERVVPIPAARMERWLFGRELAPEFAGRTVRVLTVICSSEGRRVRRIERVQPKRMRFLADGRLDTELVLADAGERAGLAVGPESARDRRGQLARLKELDAKQGFPVTKGHMRALDDVLLGPARS